MLGRSPAPWPTPPPSVVEAGLATYTVLDRVVESFLNAPIVNPDGTSGIYLHIQLDETDIPLRAFSTRWNEFDALKNGELPDFRDGRFGTRSQRSNPNWLKIRTAKRVVYRYGMFADRFGDTRFAGNAEMPGNDFMVTLGAWQTPGGDVDQQVGTFMHELGHTLGLQHGGADDLNFKPNYYSVMNYHWQMPLEDNVGWSLDFSRQALPTLDEKDLSEPQGIGFPTAAGWDGYTVQVGPLPFQPAPLVGPFDWDRNGQIDSNKTVQADINRGWADRNGDGFVNADDETPGELLKGHDDWSNLRYVFTDLRNFREFDDGDTERPEDPDPDPTDQYDLTPVDFFEDNDEMDHPAVLPPGDLLLDGLTLDDPEDIDWFSWFPPITGLMELDLFIETLGSDLNLSVFSTDGVELATSDHPVEDERIELQVNAAETLLIRVGSPNFNTGVYDLLITVQGSPGDLNLDGVVNSADIDYLFAAIRRHDDNPRLDLDQNDRLDQADARYFLETILGTTVGDANLDGSFDSSDLVQIFVRRRVRGWSPGKLGVG